MPGGEQPFWPAPLARGPVSGTVDVPGSKSISNRALVLAAIAGRRSTLRGLLRARDTDLMTAALRALGTRISIDNDVTTVDPAPLAGPAHVDCGLAGNVMRFIPAVAGLAAGRITFDGDPRARERPLAGLLEALRRLGVPVAAAAGALPFHIDAAGSVRGGSVAIDASQSSQFVSALLLAGARYEQGLEVMHRGDPIPSQPHIAMTIAMLEERGVSVARPAANHWVVAPGPVGAVDQAIEADLSNAAPFLAAAVVTGGTVTVPRWPEHTEQPGAAVPEILERFGAAVVRTRDSVSVSGTGDVRGTDIDLHDHGELTPVVAAVAALASSPTRISGVAHLRWHESDRLAALAHELGELGCDVRETADGLDIRSPATRPGPGFQTYRDHRMAHAAAVLGLRIPSLLVADVATTAKTFPGFAGTWTSLIRGLPGR
jgi:3-phosphoshikimate 1-carboxyvinyltransferase